jgi:MinD-like ATPase involved in chromosome partitioning or flagellar assembly
MTAKVVTFVSGKGGTGKTTVCISAGLLLSAAGHRVRMVDGDLATHGLTYFFDGFRGVAAMPSDPDVFIDSTPVELPVDGKLSLLPSSSATDLETSSDADRWEAAVQALATAVDTSLEESDFVLVDCQAGVSIMLDAIVNRSDHIIVVTEADPVSVGAVEGLVRVLRRSHRGSLLGFVSRVFAEEREYYEALTDYLRSIRFVGMLPFDRDVRRAFFKRESPIDLNSPGPFAVSLAQSLTSIDPEISTLISDIPHSEQYSDSKVKEEIEELIQLRDQAEDEYVSLLYTYRRQRLLSLGTVALGLIGIMLVLLFRSLGIISYDLIIVLLILSIALTLAAAFMVYLNRVADPRRFAVERQRRSLNRLEQRLDEYSVKEPSARLGESSIVERRSAL